MKLGIAVAVIGARGSRRRSARRRWRRGRRAPSRYDRRRRGIRARTLRPPTVTSRPASPSPRRPRPLSSVAETTPGPGTPAMSARPAARASVGCRCPNPASARSARALAFSSAGRASGQAGRAPRLSSNPHTPSGLGAMGRAGRRAALIKAPPISAWAIDGPVQCLAHLHIVEGRPPRVDEHDDRRRRCPPGVNAEARHRVLELIGHGLRGVAGEGHVHAPASAAPRWRCPLSG